MACGNYIQSLVDFINDTKPYHSKLTEVNEINQFSEKMTVHFDERLSWNITIKAAWTYPYFSGGPSSFIPTVPIHRVVSPQFRGILTNDQPGLSRGQFKVNRDENHDLPLVPLAFDPKCLDPLGFDDAFVQRGGLTSQNQPLLEGHDVFLSHGAYVFQINQTVSPALNVQDRFVEAYSAADGPFPISVTLPFTADSLTILGPATQTGAATISVTGVGTVRVYGISANPNYQPIYTVKAADGVVAAATAITQQNALDGTNPASALSKIRVILQAINIQLVNHPKPDAMAQLQPLITQVQATHPTLPSSYTGLINTLQAPATTPIITGYTTWADVDGELKALSSSLYFGKYADIAQRETGDLRYVDQQDGILTVTNIRVDPSRALFEEFTLTALNASTLKVEGSSSGLLNTMSVPVATDTTFTSPQVSFTVNRSDNLVEGTVVSLTPASKITIHPTAPLEAWSLIKVNPLAYSRPIFKSTRYGNVSSSNGLGMVQIIDQAFPTSSLTLTATSSTTFVISSDVEPNYSGIVTVGVPFNDGRLSFTISSGATVHFFAGDKFLVDIKNDPSTALDLDLYYGFDLDSFDADDLRYNTVNSALENYLTSLNFDYDSRFVNYDLDSFNLIISQTAIDGRQWRLRAIADLTRPLPLQNSTPQNMVNEIGTDDPTNPNAASQFDMANDETSEGSQSAVDPDTDPDILLYYSSQFALEYLDTTWIQIDTIDVGVPYTNSLIGMSFTIVPAAKPFIAARVTQSSLGLNSTFTNAPAPTPAPAPAPVGDNGTTTSGNNLGTGGDFVGSASDPNRPNSGTAGEGYKAFNPSPLSLQDALAAAQADANAFFNPLGITITNARLGGSYRSGSNSINADDGGTGRNIGEWFWDGVDRNVAAAANGWEGKFVNTSLKYHYDYNTGTLAITGTTSVSDDGLSFRAVPNAVTSTRNTGTNFPVQLNKAGNQPFAVYTFYDPDNGGVTVPVQMNFSAPWTEAFAQNSVPNVSQDFYRLGDRLFVPPSFQPQKIYSTDSTSGFVTSASAPSIDNTWDLGFTGSVYIARQPGTYTFDYNTYTGVWNSPSGYYTSTDGVNWVARNRVGGFAHGSAQPTVFIGYSKGRAFYMNGTSYSNNTTIVGESTADGISFTASTFAGVPLVLQQYVSPVTPAISDNAIIFYYQPYGNSQQALRSTDGGITFNLLTSLPLGYNKIIHVNNTFIAYNGQYQGDPLTLMVSTDDGDTWTPLVTPVDFGNLFSVNGGFESGNGYSNIYGDDDHTLFFALQTYDPNNGGYVGGTIYKTSDLSTFTAYPVSGTGPDIMPDLNSRTIHFAPLTFVPPPPPPPPPPTGFDQEIVDGGDVIAWTVLNQPPMSGPASLESSRSPRLVIHGDSFHDSIPALWTLKFLTDDLYTVTGQLMDGSSLDPISVSIEDDGLSYRDDAVGIDYTVRPGQGFGAGDTFTFSTYDVKPSYLVYGSVSGWQPDAIVGTWYWNGKIGFKIAKPVADLYVNGVKQVKNANKWVLAAPTLTTGQVELQRLRFDAPSMTYVIRCVDAARWMLYRNGELVASDAETLIDQYVTLKLPTPPVPGTVLILDIRGDDHPLSLGHDLGIVRTTMNRTPGPNDFVLFSRTEQDTILLSIKPQNSNHAQVLSALAPVNTDLRFVDHTANSGVPLGLTSPETDVILGWIPAIKLYYDSVSSYAEFSDPASRVLMLAASTGEKIGVVLPIADDPNTSIFRWDPTFHSKYLPLNTETTLVTLGSGWDDRIQVNMTEGVYFLLSSSGLVDDALFDDELSVSVDEQFLLNMKATYESPISVTMADGPFTGFLPGYDNRRYDFETEIGDVDGLGGAEYDQGLAFTAAFDEAQILSANQARTPDQDRRLIDLIGLVGPYLNGTLDQTTLEFFTNAWENEPFKGTISGTGFGIPDLGLAIGVEQNSGSSAATAITEDISIILNDLGFTFDFGPHDTGPMDQEPDSTSVFFSPPPNSFGYPVGTYENHSTFGNPEFTILPPGSRIIHVSFSTAMLNDPKFYIWKPTETEPEVVTIVTRLSNRLFEFSVPMAAEMKILVTIAASD